MKSLVVIKSYTQVYAVCPIASSDLCANVVKLNKGEMVVCAGTVPQ